MDLSLETETGFLTPGMNNDKNGFLVRSPSSRPKLYVLRKILCQMNCVWQGLLSFNFRLTSILSEQITMKILSYRFPIGIKSIIRSKKVIAALFCAAVLSATTTNAQTVTRNSTGTNNGYFWSFWTDSPGKASLTLGGGGHYATKWNNVGNFTAGKGWRTGARRNIKFSGRFNGGSNGYLAVYGWTKNPLVEYYVIENYGSWTPPGGTSIGTVNSDGGTYRIYKTRRNNADSIIGKASFDQYWSVRTSKRTSGTVTTGNHFNAWAKKGMRLGSTFDYQIVVTEGYHSTGNSDIFVN
jgi:endo-1,4-beta-xylanase